MIDTLFIISSKGEIIIERHFRKRVPRSVGEKFFAATRHEEGGPTEVCPVMVFPGYFVTHIFRSDIFYVGVSREESPPLVVTNFLSDVHRILVNYLGENLSSESVRSGFVIVYQLLDEIVDHGFAITTELTLLHDLVKRPRTSLLASLRRKNTGTGRSIVPWRKTGIVHSANEIYFDVEEELTALVSVNGTASICEINGKINSTCQLSGMPDVLLIFNDPSLFRHVLLNPCVRYAKYDEDRTLSFIPPDGEFELMRYKVSNIPTLPIYCRAQLIFYGGGANISLVVSPKHQSGVFESVFLTFPMPNPLDELKRLSVSQGSVSYLLEKKEFQWNIGKLTPDGGSVTCSGQVSFSRGGMVGVGVGSGGIQPGGSGLDASSPSVVDDDTRRSRVAAPAAVSLRFRLDKIAYSGLRIERVEIINETYKCFKGVKYWTTNGRYEVRSV